jgi:MFS transporter, DHA1 family, tetracycline resistance protein
MPHRIPLFPVLLVNFIGALGFSIVLPFLVFLVLKLGGNPLVYGLVGAAYPAFQLIGAPILGRWSDRHGRRKILLLSQAGTLLSWIIFAVALFLPRINLIAVDSSLFGAFTLTLPLLLLFVARAFDGLTGGNISVAHAYVADITPAEDRSRSFGLMGVSSNLGFVVGPALAGLLGSTSAGDIAPVSAALLISLVATVLVAVFLPESNPPARKQPPRPHNVREVFGQEPRNCVEISETEASHLSDVLHSKQTRLTLAIYFVIFLGFNFFYTSFPLHAAGNLHWSVADTGVFFAGLSLMMALVQGPLLRRLSRTLSDRKLVIAGGLILGTNFLLMLSPDTMVIWTAAGLFALGNGLMWPSVLSLLSKFAGERNQGAVQGFAGSLGGLASVIGLVLGGLAYEQFGARTFLASAALIFLAVLLALALLRPAASAKQRADLVRA